MKKTFTYLIAAAVLMLISSAAMAQGGLAPFVGSTHGYTVTAEDDVNNTLAWTVIGGTAGTDYTVNSGAATEQVEITWLTAGSYTVAFSETADGTGCIANKQADVVVGANTFDVSTSNPAATCNAADGTVNPNGDVTTFISFTVDMASGNAAFNPNWQITFTLTPSVAATISNVNATSGTLSGSGPYTLIGLTSSTGTGTVDITMDVTGDINTELGVILAITSATELDYNTPDVDEDDWLASMVIYALPATSDITTD